MARGGAEAAGSAVAAAARASEGTRGRLLREQNERVEVREARWRHAGRGRGTCAHIEVTWDRSLSLLGEVDVEVVASTSSGAARRFARKREGPARLDTLFEVIVEGVMSSGGGHANVTVAVGCCFCFVRRVDRENGRGQHVVQRRSQWQCSAFVQRSTDVDWSKEGRLIIVALTE